MSEMPRIGHASRMTPISGRPNADEGSDDDIVRRVIAGDTAAFAAIVRRHKDEVWKVAAALLEDRAATEGLVHHTLSQAYTRLDGYEAGRDFGRWIKAIARNLARHELRRARREVQ